MNSIASILGGFGLSAASGLNAYIPLLVVGLTARFTNWIKLSAPFDLLANEWVIAVLVLLLAVEFFADKIPLVDHVNDIIQTFVRPTAGAILFASEAHVITDIHPVLALILGLLVAFSVHATKAAARPLVTISTAGLGNPVVSTLEDIVSFGLTVLAIVAPVFVGVVLAFLLYIAYRVWTRKHRQPAAAGSSAPAPLKWPRG